MVYSRVSRAEKLQSPVEYSGSVAQVLFQAGLSVQVPALGWGRGSRTRLQGHTAG